MVETAWLDLVGSLGFPIAVAVILLWDKIKSNGKLQAVVENNNSILKDIKDILNK